MQTQLILYVAESDTDRKFTRLHDTSLFSIRISKVFRVTRLEELSARVCIYVPEQCALP